MVMLVKRSSIKILTTYFLLIIFPEVSFADTKVEAPLADCGHYKESGIPRTYLECETTHQLFDLLIVISYADRTLESPNAVMRHYGVPKDLNSEISPVMIEEICLSDYPNYLEGVFSSGPDFTQYITLDRTDLTLSWRQEESGETEEIDFLKGSCKTVTPEVYDEKERTYKYEMERHNNKVKEKMRRETGADRVI